MSPQSWSPAVRCVRVQQDLVHPLLFKVEIKRHCGKDPSKEKQPGETIHCLMKAAMEEDKRRESKDRSKEVTKEAAGLALNYFIK